MKKLRRILAITLSLLLVMMPLGVIAEGETDPGTPAVLPEDTKADITIVWFEPLKETVLYQFVDAGTALRALTLPDELAGVTASGGDVRVGVKTWTSKPEYKPDEDGIYVFTATPDEWFELEAGVEPPQIEVYVNMPEHTPPEGTPVSPRPLAAPTGVPATPPEEPVCVCETQCSAETVNENCAVCALNYENCACPAEDIPPEPGPSEPEAQGVIASFDELPDEVIYQHAELGTEPSALNLPLTLNATDADGAQLSLEVSWTPQPEYDAENGGLFVFSPEPDEPWALADGVSAPLIYAMVGEMPVMTLSLADGTMTVEGVTVGGLQAAVNALLETEEWGSQTGPSYDYDDITTLIVTGTVNDTDLIFINGLPALSILDLGGATISGTIRSGLFAYNNTLSTVTLPKTGDYAISAYMFQNCGNLNSIDVSGATGFGAHAFESSGLSSITLPNSYAVSNNMFAYCGNLRSINVSGATGFGVNAFEYSGLSSITLPNSYAVSNNMFAGCTSLKSIDVSGATGFGSGAFADSGLSSITLPNSYAVSNNMFASCTSLKSIDVSGATGFGSGAFAYSGLSSITLPNSYAVSDSMFRKCGDLNSIDVSNATLIGINAFLDCTALKQVTTGKGTITVYDAPGGKAHIIPQPWAGGAADLTLQLVATASNSGTNPFTRWVSSPDLGTMEVSPYNLTVTEPASIYPVFDGIISPAFAVFDKYEHGVNHKDLVVVPAAGARMISALYLDGDLLTRDDHYTVDGDNFTFSKDFLLQQSVGSHTLSFEMSGGGSCELSLTVINTNPDVVVTTDFSGTTGGGSLQSAINRETGGPDYLPYANITSLSFKSGITATLNSSDIYFIRITLSGIAKVDMSNVTIGGNALSDSALQGHASLEIVTLPTSVTKLGNFAFYQCSKLKTVSGGSITSVGTQAFNQAPQLQSVMLAEGAALGNMCFDGCSKLETVGANAIAQMGWQAFNGCANLTGVTLKDGIDVPTYAFTGCVSLKKVNGIIGSTAHSAFYQCKALENITLADDSVVGVRAFGECTSLKTVSGTIKTVEHSGFDTCSALESVVLVESAELGMKVFNNCKSLKSVGTNTIASLGESAFYSCEALENVKLADDIAVPPFAFYGCKSLTSVGGIAIKSAEWAAFYGCAFLESIDLTQVTSLGDAAFRNCAKLWDIDWWTASPTIGTYALSGCALDFSKGFPAGLNKDNAGNQTPRVFFSPARTSDTIVTGNALDVPWTLKTKDGTPYADIIGEPWVVSTLAVPDVTPDPTWDITTVGTRNYTFEIPAGVFANTHSLSYALTVLAEMTVSGPVDQRAASGENAVFSVAVTNGTPPYGYAWRVYDTQAEAEADTSGAGGTAVTNDGVYNGADTDELTVTADMALDGKWYKCFMTDSHTDMRQSAYSGAAQLSVYVSITGIVINEPAATVDMGSKTTYTATVSPAGYTTTNPVTWTSGTPNVASVDGRTGEVTAVSAGTAVITATIIDGDNGDVPHTASVTVTVNPAPAPRVAITGITINEPAATLDIGGKTVYTATVSPAGYTTTNPVTWTSDNPNAASVDGRTGEVTAVSTGTAVITATIIDSDNGDTPHTTSVTVTVNPAPAPRVAITGIAINEPDATLDIGGKTIYTATVSPAGYTTTNPVTWTSGNPNVASVDGRTGEVTAVSTGTAVITATIIDGDNGDVPHTTSVTVTVNPAPAPRVAITGITINEPDATLDMGGKTTYTATVSPTGYTTTNPVTWTSDDSNVASVNASTGEVTAVSTGTAVITATIIDGDNGDAPHTASVTVTVNPESEDPEPEPEPEDPIAVTGVKLNKTSATVKVDKTLTLTATVEPEDAANKTVTWKSADKSIATVSAKGIVTGVKAGETTITVTTEDGGYTAKCAITVTEVETDEAERYLVLPQSPMEGLNHITGVVPPGSSVRITVDGVTIDTYTDEYGFFIAGGADALLPGQTVRITVTLPDGTTYSRTYRVSAWTEDTTIRAYPVGALLTYEDADGTECVQPATPLYDEDFDENGTLVLPLLIDNVYQIGTVTIVRGADGTYTVGYAVREAFSGMEVVSADLRFYGGQPDEDALLAQTEYEQPLDEAVSVSGADEVWMTLTVTLKPVDPDDMDDTLAALMENAIDHAATNPEDERAALYRTYQARKASGVRWRVTADNLNVRSGPGREYGVADVLDADQLVTGEDMGNGWVKLGEGRYAAKQYLEIVG